MAAAARIYNLGPLEQIPVGEGREFALGAERVAVFRGRGGKLFASDAVCPHAGGRIADGIVGGSTVVCPLHAYRFDLRSGDPVGGSCQPLTTYPVWVGADGSLMLQTE